MHVLTSPRARAVVAAFAALLAISAAVVPASADTGQQLSFELTNDHDVTNFAPCLPGLPINAVACGYGLNEPMTVVSGLSGSVTESFVSALGAGAPTSTCGYAIPDYSTVTLNSAQGEIFMVTHDGSYCTTTNTDIEPFYVVGGTGAFAGATGSGTITAHATGQNATGTQGYASETYVGSILLAHQ